MKYFKVLEADYSIICNANTGARPLPYLLGEGTMDVMCPSPLHGRSFVAEKSDSGYRIIKGCGLSYTEHRFLNTTEMGDGCWGLLLEKDAIRDFVIGNEVASLGIKTNVMEYVMRIEEPVYIGKTKDNIYPYLLQYSAQTPWRIEDAPFMTKETIYKESSLWPTGSEPKYLYAANVLFKNLNVLHDNGILHNALTTHNYTWQLELLDFELAHSPNCPYGNSDDQKYIPILKHREILHTYQIVSYIAGVLNEEVDCGLLSSVMGMYGFDFNDYIVK